MRRAASAVVLPKDSAGTACRSCRVTKHRAVATSAKFQMPGNRVVSLFSMSSRVQGLPCLRLCVVENPAFGYPFLEDIIAGSLIP